MKSCLRAEMHACESNVSWDWTGRQKVDVDLGIVNILKHSQMNNYYITKVKAMYMKHSAISFLTVLHI